MDSSFHIKGVGGAGAELSRALVAARLKGGVMVVDRNFRVVMIDRKAAEFCAVSAGQSQGKRFYALFPALLGTDFAASLHEIISTMDGKRFFRPADNSMLDQFVDAFSRDYPALLGISIKAYEDESNSYGLIQLRLQNSLCKAEDSSGASPGINGRAAVQPLEDLQKGEPVVLDSGSAFIVTDRHGFISRISASAERLFCYSNELLAGSSVRILFPGLDGMDSLDLRENFATLRDRHIQGYLLAATSQGQSRYLDVTLFESSVQGDEIIIVCRDWTHASQQTDELVNRGQLFDLTSRHIADGVIMVDAEGFLQEMNPIAEQLLGFEFDKSSPTQIHVAMPLANEESGVTVTPVHDALNKAINIESNQSLLLKVRDSTPTSVSVSAFPLRDSMGRITKCLVLFRPLSEARRVSSRLKWQAMHDPLTGLPNRASLSKGIQKAVEIAKLEGAIHALLYIDLYNFSVINDTSGHNAGDELLKQFAQLLVRLAEPGDMAARIGNDEFALLMSRVNYDKAMAMAERILNELKELSIPWEGEQLKIGASVGGILIDADAVSDIDLMISAGSSCATARDKGRNKIHFQSFNEEVAKRRSLATSMPKIVSALDEDRFTLFAQPIVSVNRSSGPAKYYEVLVRMRDSDGGILQPSEFIPVAEHFSLIDDLDKWVFNHSLKFLQALKDKGAELPMLSVNLSGSTVGDENAIDYILSGFS